VRLRQALLKLLEQFSFRDQITRPVRRAVADEELPQVMLNYNSLEALRRAFLAAIKSIEYVSAPPASLSEPPASAGGKTIGGSNRSREHAEAVDKAKSRPPADAGGSDKTNAPDTTLATFIEEVRRSLSSQSVVFGAANAQGLRVLEATDVRGLRFRVVFIAGLVEGGFPLRASRDWIYPHEERERLKRYGLTLEDISPATLLKEEHYFYQAACRATEHLISAGRLRSKTTPKPSLLITSTSCGAPLRLCRSTRKRCGATTKAATSIRFPRRPS